MKNQVSKYSENYHVDLYTTAQNNVKMIIFQIKILHIKIYNIIAYETRNFFVVYQVADTESA